MTKLGPQRILDFLKGLSHALLSEFLTFDQCTVVMDVETTTPIKSMHDYVLVNARKNGALTGL